MLAVLILSVCLTPSHGFWDTVMNHAQQFSPQIQGHLRHVREHGLLGVSAPQLEGYIQQAESHVPQSWTNHLHSFRQNQKP